MRVDSVVLGPGSAIGPFNVFRDIKVVSIGEASVIGQWNWISAARPLVEHGGSGSFFLGRHSALTSRHYLDVSGGISIGHFTTVAGVRSTLLTHGINWTESVQVTKGIFIGDYCLISSNNAIAPGTHVPDRSVSGMGATLAGKMEINDSLWISPRAAIVKSGLAGKYFERKAGFVQPETPVEHKP
jgi:UDP-3-O-[3-hydroxymyristoyl] glucosamine N-acyltransferase